MTHGPDVAAGRTARPAVASDVLMAGRRFDGFVDRARPAFDFAARNPQVSCGKTCFLRN